MLRIYFNESAGKNENLLRKKELQFTQYLRSLNLCFPLSKSPEWHVQ